MIRQLAPRQKSVHLLFGGHYATALEHFYKHRALGDDIDTALLKVVREAMENSWEYKTCETCQGMGYLSPDDPDDTLEDCPDCLLGKVSVGPQAFLDNAKTRFNLIRTIVWYVEQFGDETAAGITTHHLSNGKPAVELSFTLDLDDEFVLCGHLDRVVDYGGSLFVMDQKTTGSTIGPYFFKPFDLDTQMTLYSIAGQVVLQSPVAGVIIDGAQIAVNFSRFERGFTYRTKDQLEEFLQNTKHVVRTIQSYTLLDFFPMNTTACGNYGGCPFAPLCKAPPKLREKVMETEYSTRVWSPIERR
jgi:hypothetical protein